MKIRKKAFLIAVSAILVVVATAFGTLAYLTSEITVTHTFTVGDVEVNVSVANTASVLFDGDTVQEGTDKVLVPNYEYSVPVSIQLGNQSEKAWVFVQVINPFKDVEAASGTTTSFDEPYKTLNEQIAANKWVPLTYDGANVGGVYFFNGGEEGASHIAEAGWTLPLYDYFKVSHEAKGGTVEEAIAELSEDNTDGETVTLTDEEKKLYLGEYADDKMMVIVYVVQADGLETVDAAWSIFEGQYEKNVAKYTAAK